MQTLNFLRKRPDTNRTDFKYNWPAQIFTHVCKCKGNWAGYDCSRCKRGYSGNDCTNNHTAVRKSFLDLSSSEKNRVIEVLNMAKNMESDFTVPIDEEPSSTDSFKPLSLYDIFATFHYYTIRDEDLYEAKPSLDLTKNDIPDFAHEGPAFLSWHRAYLLYFETELQHMLNDSSFALPYWDWTAFKELKARNDPECPDIFTRELFGETNTDCINEEPVHENGLSIMTDHFNWIPVCTNYEYLRNVGELCNPYSIMTSRITSLNSSMSLNSSISLNGTGSLSITRCIGRSLGSQCSARGQLPTTSDVNTVNCKTYYDGDNYDRDSANCGFRNALEGHCKFNDKPIENCPDFSEMHNKVHVYIGGLMKDVPTSSNDPIFWLHHCNVDR